MVTRKEHLIKLPNLGFKPVKKKSKKKTPRDNPIISERKKEKIFFSSG